MKQLVLGMMWKWGGAKVIRCTADMTIEEVAGANGFSEVNRTVPIFIYKGQILRPELTLQHYKIPSGAMIIAYIGFACPDVTPKYRPRFPFAWPRAESIDEIKDKEMGRIADQDFRCWETVRAFPQVLKDILLDEERAEQESDAQQEPEETIVAPSHVPSDAPLPLLFRRDDDFGYHPHELWTSV
jgi:hypothetical protein